MIAEPFLFQGTIAVLRCKCLDNNNSASADEACSSSFTKSAWSLLSVGIQQKKRHSNEQIGEGKLTVYWQHQDTG